MKMGLGGYLFILCSHSRSGMTVCADHGGQKKGFDSLTGTENYCKF